MKSYEIKFNNFKIKEEHKNKIIQFIKELILKYNLEKNKFKLEFKEVYFFGQCYPSLNLNKKNRKVKITINKDLLKEELFEELKGTLAHEFAHFYHYINFSRIDFFKFIYRIGGYIYSRKISHDKFIIFERYNQAYEQITDLTACNFGYKKELKKLKKYISIYRKNLSKELIPNNNNYLSEKFLKKLKKENISKEVEIRKKSLGFKSLKYN